LVEARGRLLSGGAFPRKQVGAGSQTLCREAGVDDRTH
jgi:hypothetical protein